jgi:hypothetical protein
MLILRTIQDTTIAWLSHRHATVTQNSTQSTIRQHYVKILRLSDAVFKTFPPPTAKII